MQTLVFLLIIFLIVIFSILLYFKTKHSRLDKFNKGQCPNCNDKTKIFFDKNTNTTFEHEIITKKLLKNDRCSGTIEIQYQCKTCKIKEVHQISN